MEQQIFTTNAEIALTGKSIPKNEIDQVFLRFGAIYFHRFNSLFPNNKSVKVAKAEWANALGELSKFQINQGLLRCRSISDWNPNIPEFIRLATNLPDVFTAINRVMKRNIIDPVTRDICSEISSFDFNNNTQSELKNKIRSAYQDIYERVLNEIMGKTKNWEPPVQITHKIPKEAVKKTKELGRSYIKQARENLSKSTEEKSKPVTIKSLPEYDEEKVLKDLESHYQDVML